MHKKFITTMFFVSYKKHNSILQKTFGFSLLYISCLTKLLCTKREACSSWMSLIKAKRQEKTSSKGSSFDFNTLKKVSTKHTILLRMVWTCESPFLRPDTPEGPRVRSAGSRMFCTDAFIWSKGSLDVLCGIVIERGSCS